MAEDVDPIELRPPSVEDSVAPSADATIAPAAPPGMVSSQEWKDVGYGIQVEKVAEGSNVIGGGLTVMSRGGPRMNAATRELTREEKRLLLAYYALSPEFQAVASKMWFAGVPEKKRDTWPVFDPEQERALWAVWYVVTEVTKAGLGRVSAADLMARLSVYKYVPNLAGDPDVAGIVGLITTLPEGSFNLEKCNALLQQYMDFRVVMMMRPVEGGLLDHRKAFNDLVDVTRVGAVAPPPATYETAARRIITTLTDGKGPRLLGPSTGFDALDEITGGLRKKAVWLIEGPPGVSKTTMMVQMGGKVAEKGARALYVTLEQDADALWDKLYAALSQIDSMALGRGATVSDASPFVARMEAALARVAGWEGALDIRDAAQLGGEAAMAAVDANEIQRLARDLKPDVLFVDYLQLVGDAKSKSEFETVGNVVKALQRLAAKEQICVVAAVAQNRDAYSSKRALMNDSQSSMRGSAFLEYAATVVLKLTPDLDEVPEEVWGARGEAGYAARIAELSESGVSDPSVQKYTIRMDTWKKQTVSNMVMTVMKNKYGPLGKAVLRFNKALSWIGTQEQPNPWKS
jgi:replicative DNA helicase